MNGWNLISSGFLNLEVGVMQLLFSGQAKMTRFLLWILLFFSGHPWSEPSKVSLFKCCNVTQVFSEADQKCIEGLFSFESLAWFKSVQADESPHFLEFPTEIDVQSGLLSSNQDCHGHGMKVATFEKVKLLTDGRAFLPTTEVYLSGSHPHEFCIEQFVTPDEHHDGQVDIRVVACHKEAMEKHMHCSEKFRFYPVLMLVSCVALVLTLVTYLILPELRNVPGKNLMSLCLSLLGGYLLLSVEQEYFITMDSVDTLGCLSLGIIMDFFFLSAFTWMTIMSFDMFVTFRKLVPHRRANPDPSIESSSNHFAKYAMVGWGGPLVTCSLTLVANQTNLIGNESFKPNIGVNSCWFQGIRFDSFMVMISIRFFSGTMPTLIYFYGPLALLSLVNLIMFTITMVNLANFGMALSGDNGAAGGHPIVLRRHSGSQDVAKLRHRFWLHLRLFAIMGTAWVFEVISWNLDMTSLCPLWYLLDSFNILQGLWIFLTFAAKRSVVKRLWQKLGSR